MNVAFYTLGCKVNFYETEALSNLFKQKNYKIVDFNDKADVYVINTCSVTNLSDAKSRKYIRKAIRNNKDAIIVAMGCYAQINKEEIQSIEGVNIIVGSTDKMKVIDYVEDYIINKQVLNVVHSLDNVPFEAAEVITFEHKTRAFVKIQDGCENYCAYCIIPYTRGPVRSKPQDLVIKEINNLVNHGYQEVVLTGIHTGHYGADLPNYNFAQLLRDITKIVGLKRLRISSIEITELDDEVLDVIKNNDVIANHLHIPLQSGSDKILKAMNRKYDTAFFEDKINKIRKIRPDIAITTDVIVGLPGETEADFKDTYEFIKKVGFYQLHIFPYSKRKGTRAATMLDQVDSSTAKQRVEQLMALSEQLEKKYIESFINKKIDVIPEVMMDDYLVGHSSNYLRIKYKGHKNELGLLKNVVIKEIDYPFCIANDINNEVI